MARGPRPTAAFASTALDLTSIAVGKTFGRLYASHHADPLGFGKTRSRYSDPRRRKPENRFGVLYLGESLKVCFLEGLLRDERNGVVDDYPLDETELDTKRFAQVEVAAPLRLVELRGDGPVRMGVPSDVARAADQTLARHWSAAFHEHQYRPDGIIYPSRLNGQTSLAIYGRAIAKLRAAGWTSLRHAAGLAAVLDDLKVAIAPTP
jgi:hypothetical protein